MLTSQGLLAELLDLLASLADPPHLADSADPTEHNSMAKDVEQLESRPRGDNQGPMGDNQRPRGDNQRPSQLVPDDVHAITLEAALALTLTPNPSPNPNLAE